MHCSRMRTVRCSGNLSCHACPLPYTPPAMHVPCHTCPPAMHAPCHASPLPCMPPATHDPLPHTHPCHACPLCHASPPPCKPRATHDPLPHTHPCHACPPTHAPYHACPPWTEFLTHACENITFAQLLLRTVKIISRPRRLPQNFRVKRVKVKCDRQNV